MNALIEKGIKAFRATRYAEAIAFYEQALRDGADDPRLHVLLATAYHHHGQLELARTYYEMALSRTDSPAILQTAQTGLAKLARAQIPHREPSGTTDALRLPSRPRGALMTCPLCGETLVKEACVCGFLPSDPDRIGLDRVQAYCEEAKVIMFVRLGRDTYVIDRDRVGYRTANEQLAAIDPRILFRALHGIPMIRREELRPVAPFQAPWVAYPRPGRPGDPRPFTWDAFLEAVGESLGLELPEPLPPFDASQVYAMFRQLPPAEIARLRDDAQRGGLTFGQGLMRANPTTSEALLRDLQGEGTYFLPSHRMANSLGWDLMADGLLEPDELREIITRQVEYPKPMIQLILSSTPLSAEEVEPVAEVARQRKAVRPFRDRLGELLVRRGALTRAQLQDAFDVQLRMPGSRLGDVLREKGLPEPVLEEALNRQQIKDQLRYGGQARLGEILVKRGVVSRQQLLAALHAQINQPWPLGEILIRQGMATPEQIYLALEQQEMALDALVESEIAMERQDQAPAPGTLTLSIDLEREKKRLHDLWGGFKTGLKTGLKAGVKEVKQAIEAVRELEARERQESRED